jgi:hypothetical protein
MGFNLGLKLRQRYAGLIPTTLDSSYVVQTTEVGRTIQTCEAVLRALFNTTLEFIPHSPIATDYLLAFPGNYPSNVLFSSRFNSVMLNNSVAAQFLNASDLDFLASMFGSWCYDEPTLCGLLGEDVGQCTRSNGPTAMSPAYLQLFEEKLVPMQVISNKWNFGFDPSSPYAPIGSTGYPIMSEILRHATERLAQGTGEGDGGATRNVFHYSAHDNTVIGAFNTIGAAQLNDTNGHIWVPKFAQTLLVETYDDGFVDFYWMKPNETFGSGFFFPDPTPLTVRCTTAGGTVYSATSCLLADAFRFVNSSQPMMDVISAYRGGSNPYCWLAEGADRERCGAVDAMPSTECQQYRAACPEVACDPATAVLDISSGYICVSFAERHHFSEYAAGSIAAGVGALVLGTIIGMAISKVMSSSGHEEFD